MQNPHHLLWWGAIRNGIWFSDFIGSFCFPFSMVFLSYFFHQRITARCSFSFFLCNWFFNPHTSHCPPPCRALTFFLLIITLFWWLWEVLFVTVTEVPPSQNVNSCSYLKSKWVKVRQRTFTRKNKFYISEMISVRTQV